MCFYLFHKEEEQEQFRLQERTMRSFGRLFIFCLTAFLMTTGCGGGWDFTSTWSISSSINGGYPYLTGMEPQEL
jgi:hypothetical protein